MGRAYYATRLSDNISETPEKYLVCRNVPIARTGWQEYMGREVGLDSDETIRVYRDPEQVFNPATIASFEGKSVTDSHPLEWVSPHNENNYHRGHVQNVRRGTGEDSDYLLADLFVKDANLINKVKNGTREVSCGYDCTYEPVEDGKYLQTNIRGNHVAVVPAGRAGDRVAIRDAVPEQLTKPDKKRSSKMNWKTILGLGLKQYAQDAEPEEVANAFEAAKEAGNRMEKRNEDCGIPAKPRDAEPPAPPAPAEGSGANVMPMLERILAVLEQLVQTDKETHAMLPKEPAPEDALDELVAELEGGKEHEAEQAAGTEDADVIDPVETLPPEDRPKNPIPGADAIMTVAALKAIRPIIAQIKDSTERKKACDALISAFKQQKAPGTQKASYADFMKAKKAQDEKRQSQAQQDHELGQKIKELYHRKAVAKPIG